ncbi:hypothetical protein HHK36_002224 [Tetracentron sinense]|uniref:WRKY domain-containing protein n=1 Tax=Tetracentron sinense TaxID=13715 RepID=A0A834ZU45_TETSI|nr:hypothetical protein HHK36_002224 [Tetracentron sinense]
MDENVKFELRDPQRIDLEEENRASQLRFDISSGRIDAMYDHDNASNDGYLKRNVFSVKLESRVLSGAGSNAARYKSMSPARLPISRSPCLTIPPGLSPTSLLDSPVLLSNMKAEPSPTTGSFFKPQMMHGHAGSTTFSSRMESSNYNSYDKRSCTDFEFKPQIRSSSDPSSLAPLAPADSNYQQLEPFVQVQGQCQSQSFASSPSVKSEKGAAFLHDLNPSATAPNPLVHMVTSRASVPAEIACDELQQRQGPDTGVQALQSDQRGSSPSIVAERSSEDGYNWRKYGQKHVKGSEFPRSYYKCTHPNCEVKKQLERSHDGQIAEIVYKGSHDHPKPLPSRRLAVGTILSINEERPDKFPSLTSTENKSSIHGQTSYHIEPNSTLELSPVTASDGDVEGAVTHSNWVGDEVDDDDDPDSKRRKKDIGGTDVTPILKPTREPRVVVQTMSEVDILDDGYRWRKYGQKVVKGNPNPRSYYKCTNAGCPVRKHVERASHDLKAVITTYEGKHNHDVPAARTSSHDTAGTTIYTTALSGMLRTKVEEGDTISLDLGVGISSSPENRSTEKQQTLDAEPVQSQTLTASSRVIQATSVLAHHGVLNRGVDPYGSREDGGESFSFKTPALNHSSNPYPQNMGRLIMGP